MKGQGLKRVFKPALYLQTKSFPTKGEAQMMQEFKIKEKYFKTKYESHKNKFKKKLVHTMNDELKETLT